MTSPRVFLLARCALALAALLAAALAGCNGDVANGTEEDQCTVDGVTYEVGDSFPAPDGCNTCTCEEGGQAACTLMGCVDTCEYGGAVYSPGDSFPADDGCNTCTCDPEGGGAVLCTEVACVSCIYAGEPHQPGDSFPALDGCNTCTCQPDGTISCTEIACACDPQVEWWREYVSLDAQECLLLDFGCPAHTLRFDNTCGCGCEQSASCPQSFDCMPPNECDVAWIQENCPYSEIAF